MDVISWGEWYWDQDRQRYCRQGRDQDGRIILDVAPPQQTDVTVPRDPPYSDLSAQFNDLSLDSGASYAATDAYSHGQGQDHSGYAQGL
jgi:hypothetical protein